MLVPRPVTKPLIVMAALIVVLSACSGGDDGATLEAVDEPTPTTIPTQEPPVATADEPADSSPHETAPAVEAEVDSPGDESGTDNAPSPSPTADRDVDLSKPAFTELSKVSTVGLDEIFFGMTADEAAAAADTAWESKGSVTSECWFATPVNGPVGVSFMIWNGSVERLDVTTDLITTRSGAGVGSTPEELRELFGDLLDESDPMLLAFVPTDEGDANFRIFFTMVDGMVGSYRAGRLPMVELPACP